MTLRLAGSTSGYTEIDAPAVAGSNTLVLPTGNGSAGNILGTDGSGNLSWVNGRMVLATAQNSTSGTSIDFTGIPSWVKRVTVIINGVSTSGSSTTQVQIGSGSFTTSGYAGSYTQLGASNSQANFTSGFALSLCDSATVQVGTAVLNLISGNTWIYASNIGRTNQVQSTIAAGLLALSGTLDRVRITTVNGTDTFDAGSINILYEG